jgi:hypothetical protein
MRRMLSAGESEPHTRLEGIPASIFDDSSWRRTTLLLERVMKQHGRELPP